MQATAQKFTVDMSLTPAYGHFMRTAENAGWLRLPENPTNSGSSGQKNPAINGRGNGYSKTIPSALVALAIAVVMSGCATPASRNYVQFNVTSEPSGCPVEINGVHSGNTPTTINLGLSKHWVGVMNSPNGWEFGNEVYQVTCFPPPESSEQLTSQTKVITPSMTPNGADLYFNLRLQPVTPTALVDIKQEGKSEIVIKKDSKESSVVEKMRDLKEMKDEGLISAEEYEAKRKMLLEKL